MRLRRAGPGACVVVGGGREDRDVSGYRIESDARLAGGWLALEAFSHVCRGKAVAVATVIEGAGDPGLARSGLWMSAPGWLCGGRPGTSTWASKGLGWS